MNKYFGLILVLLMSATASADLSKCTLRGQGIINKANEIANSEDAHDNEAFVHAVDLEATFTNKGNKFSGAVEGFYRPIKNTKFSIVPTSLLAVELSRNKHTVYVCAQINEDDQYEIEIYFLSGVFSDEEYREVIDEIFKKDSVRLAPLSLSVLNFGTDHGGSKPSGNPLKIFLMPFVLNFKIFSGFANIFSVITGINVQRVRITNDKIQVSGGINMNDPEHPRFSKTIDMASEEGRLLSQFRSK